MPTKAPAPPTRRAIADSTTGPNISNTATSTKASPSTAAIFRAVTRRFRNERVSFSRLYARSRAVMYEFIAPVTAQTASTKPMTVATMLPPGCESARRSELLSSVNASFGITPWK